MLSGSAFFLTLCVSCGIFGDAVLKRDAKGRVWLSVCRCTVITIFQEMSVLLGTFHLVVFAAKFWLFVLKKKKKASTMSIMCLESITHTFLTPGIAFTF